MARIEGAATNFILFLFSRKNVFLFGVLASLSSDLESVWNGALYQQCSPRTLVDGKIERTSGIDWSPFRRRASLRKQDFNFHEEEEEAGIRHPSSASAASSSCG
jgi:hypothetical protein